MYANTEIKNPLSHPQSALPVAAQACSVSGGPDPIVRLRPANIPVPGSLSFITPAPNDCQHMLKHQKLIYVKLI